LPPLIGEARLTSQTAGPPAHSLLAQSYELAAFLMVHMGKEDLGALAAERAFTSAVPSNDELLHAIVQGTYAWVLLHQGRLAQSEKLAVTVADRMEPSFSAPTKTIAVWGNLLMTALAPAAAAGHDFSQYVALASAGAERLRHKVNIYQTSFGPALVHMRHATPTPSPETPPTPSPPLADSTPVTWQASPTGGTCLTSPKPTLTPATPTPKPPSSPKPALWPPFGSATRASPAPLSPTCANSRNGSPRRCGNSPPR